MGNILLIIAFVSAVVSTVFYTVAGLRKKDSFKANWVFYVHAGAIVASSFYLLFCLLTHQFRYHYVYANTDSTLNWPYLLSAFWAGQQGSFLFWALCGALVSLLVLRRSVRPLVMATLTLGQSFLTLFLVQDTPFRLMAHIPSEGLGLNPLLLNPWMIIHPPIIFIGYALLIVPMAYSIAALIDRDFHEGLVESLPWALLGWVFLGAGILIGGVWAYQVLGWGGYWAWDPVENSSLIPWLTCGALIHGLLVQRKRSVFLRPNHFLSITTYLLVIAATFITRSGMMADYSVHAFAQTPLSLLLGVFALVFAVLGYGIFLLRFSEIAYDGERVSMLSRPVVFGVTMLILSISAALIMLGTLAPIITGWTGLPATVESSFYTTTNGPLVTVLLVLLGLIPLVGKGKLSWASIENSLTVPICVLSASIVGSFLLGVRAPLDLLFIGTAVFAGASNLMCFVHTWKARGLKFTGAYIAHLGLALILVGFLVSTNYTRTETVYLSAGRETEALGYHFTWSGSKTLDIGVQKRASSAMVRPKMYMAGSRQMREPGINRNLWQDIYVSPIEIAAEFDGQILMREGRYFAYDDYSLHFSELRHNPHAEGEAVEVSAILIVRYLGDVSSVTPTLKINPDGVEYYGAKLPHSNETIFLQAVDATDKLAWFTIGDTATPRKDLLIVEVKTKPLISALGLGALLLCLGTAVACWRRFLKP